MGAKSQRVVHFIRQGKDGEKGAVLRIQKWNSVADGFAFECGGEGDTYKDVVVYRDNYFSCMHNHAKTANNYPQSAASENGKLWALSDKVESVATQILLAKYALVKNLGVETIEQYDSNGNVIFRVKDGNVECNRGTFTGVNIKGALMSGDVDGQRVEIDPDNKNVSIYGADGKICTQIDGTEYTDISELLPSAGLEPPTLIDATFQIDPQGEEEYLKEETSTPADYYTSGSVRLDFSVTSYLRINNREGDTGTETGGIQKVPSATLYCIVESSRGGKVYKTQSFALLNVIRETDLGHGETKTQNLSLFLDSGKHSIFFKIVADASKKYDVSGYCKASGATASTDMFLSRYFKNGLALTRNNSNYLLALFQNDIMRLIFKGEFNYQGIKQPHVMFSGSVNEVASAASLMQKTGLSRPTLTRGESAKDGYTLRFGDDYGELPLNNATIIVTGVGHSYNTSSPNKATVVSYGGNSATIVCSDGSTPRYGSFNIIIYK